MEEWQNAFGGALERLFQDDEFNSEFTPDQYGLVIQGALDRFAEKYEISDKSQLEKIAQEKHQELRNRRGITRFQPKEEEFSQYYVPFDIDESKPISERIESIDDWVKRSADKASSIRASEREDFEYHLRDIANDYIRREKAKEEKPGLLGDTWNRGVQAIAEPFYRIGNEKKSDRYFAEHLVEDPERDEDLFSKFVVGGGEFIPQLAISSALWAAGQPQLIAPVFGALFGARYMREGYYEEMKRSGNKQMAMGNAFAQLPAAGLDTFSEVFLLGAGKTGKAFFKEFLAASTEEAKRAVLKKAIPSILKESGTQYLSEGLIGGAGADFASGFGSWIATGDEKYLENATNIQKLAESAFVEGTLGAGVGAGLTALGKNSEIRGVSEQIRNLTLSSKKDQQFVFDALKRKDYDSVMNFLSRNIQVKDETEYNEAIDLLKKESGAISSKPDEPKKQNETKEEKKAREFISNSEYVINLRKRLKEIEGDEVKQDEADRLRANIKSIQEGKFTEKEEFDSEITQEEVSGYSFKGFDPSKDQSSGVFDTTLEDGNKLDDENVVFIQPNNFTNKRTFNSLELLYGASPTVIFSPNKDTAKIVLPGKGIGSQELKASTSPKKGWIPVRVTSEQKDGGYKTKVSFLPKVKEYNKLKLDPKKYQVINRDDNSITIRNEGRDYKLTGNAANYIASQQEAVNNRELDKFLEKNSDRLELVYKLWEKASNNKWTEQEKNDFIANVDGAIDTLENLSKLDNDDTFIEIAMKLLDAKASLSKINVSKTNNEISLIETKEEDIGEETEETIEQETKEDTKTKKKSPHKLSLDDTLDTAENRGVYYDGKQGKIINENGDYLFVSNSGITYDLGTQRGDISLKDAGVSIRLSNKITKTKISKPQKSVVKKEETNKQTQEQEPKAKEPEVQDQQIQEPEAKEPEVQDQQIQEPQIRIAFVNYALKLARSEDNRLSGDYFINNKFTKDELNYIGKEAGVDVDGKSEYEIADEINTKLGKTRDRLDRKKDNEFKKTGDKLNPNSIRKSKSSIGSTEKRDIKRRIIDRLKNSIGFNKVIVVNTQEELPNNVKIDENEKVEGFADSSGNVYIVLDNIEDSQQEVERVFVHEVFGHLGVAETLRGMSLKGYLSLKSKIESYRNGDLWKSIQKKYEGDTESVWVDESIAHIFNDRRPEARSIVRAILDKIRIALVKAGIKKWSNNDIEALIRETFSKRKFDKGVSIVGASNVSFSKADKISSRDIANHSIISHYGAWIDKSGNLFLIDGESNDFPHYEKALEILEIKDDNNITDVYEQMYKKGYVSIRKNQGDGYVEAGTGRNLTISQKATLENIGINDEIRIILDNGVSGTKTIYSPPTANDLARFSKKQENEQSFDNSLDAGGGFIFAMQKPINNKIGKHTIPNHGIVSEDQFKKIALGSNEILPKHEFEFYKLLVPSAFSEKGVDVNELYEGLKEINNSITVEVYGQNGNVSEAKTELDRMTHEWLEMEFNHDQRAIISSAAQGTSQDRKIAFHHVTDRQAEKLKVFFELTDKVASEPSDTSLRATSHYDTVSPYDTKKYPVVRVDVSLPERRIAFEDYWKQLGFDSPTSYKGKELTAEQQASLRKDYETKYGYDKKSLLWPPDNLHENLPNTLGWAMVQFVPDPRTGEMVAFVGEQQSQWGQKRYANTPKTAEGEQGRQWTVRFNDPKVSPMRLGGNFKTAEEAMAYAQREHTDKNFPPSPLLEPQASLVLKAVIREAQKRGVKKIVVSDGETAMMTEGHDQNLGVEVQFTAENLQKAQAAYRQELGEYNPDPSYLSELKSIVESDLSKKTSLGIRKTTAEKAGLSFKPEQPEQAGGMRLHYDTTLPSVMKKLTGGEGEMWDGGVHKNTGGNAGIISHEHFFSSRYNGETNEQLLNDAVRSAREDFGVTHAQLEDFEIRGNDVYAKRSLSKGSPVFRNPDGTPKSSVTGRIYDISNVSNKNIRFSKADLLKLPDEALSKTGKEFATVVDNMRRPDGSTFIKEETKTPEQLDEIAKEIIRIAKDNPEYFTVKIDPSSLTYNHLYRNADGPIDMNDPIGFLSASDEAQMMWMLENDGRIEEYKQKEAEELTKMRSSILSDNANYLFNNSNYSSFESAQMLIALSKIAIRDLPNNEYRSVEISKNNRQMPMQLDGEYASYVRDELIAGKTAKEAIKSGYKKVQELSKENNKNIKDGWIKIDKSDSAEEASKLAKLCSGTGWCVSNENTASSYLKNGNFYIYFEGGKIQIGIGYNSNNLEVRGTLPGQGISEYNDLIAEKKIIDDKIEKGEDFLNDRKIIKDIYDVLKDKKDITPEFISNHVYLSFGHISPDIATKSIKDQIEELNKLFSIEIKLILKTKTISNEIERLLIRKIKKLNYDFFSQGKNGGIVSLAGVSLQGNSFSIFEKVGGDFYAPNLKEAPFLEKVNGYFDAPNLTEAPLLEKVKGSFYAQSLIEAPLLKEVNGNFDTQNLTEAPLLEKVKGSFYAQSLTEAPLLKEVNGNFFAQNLTEAPLLKEVNGNFFAQNLTEAPLLEKVNGYFDAQNLTEAPLLEKVNGYFTAPNLTEAPLLKEVNGKFYAQNLTEAPLLEKVEGSFDAPNLTEDNVRFSKHGSVQELNYFDDSLFNDFVFITKDKIAKRREISRLKGTKLEASLIIDEKQAHDALKSINPLYLNEEHLERYSSILSNFVNTRSKVDSPPLSRESIQSILSSLSEITNHQNEQIYDKYSREFPDIEGINFRKEDGTIDIEKLQDWVSSRIEIDDVLESPRLIGEDHAQYIEAVAMLQEQLSEEINDPDSVIYSMVNKDNNVIDTGDDILDKGNNIVRERLNDVKQHLNDFVSQLLQFDPLEATFKETRINYYSLMSIIGDGYPLKSGSFISSRTKRILDSEGNNFINPYKRKQSESWMDKAMSFGTKIRRLSADDKSLNALYDLVAPFREGIFNAQRWTTEVARPYLDRALKDAEILQGRHFGDFDRVKMGVYALLRRYNLTEKPGEGLKKNIEWIKKSIDNYKRSYDKELAKSAERQESIIDLLTDGLDFNSEYVMLSLEERARDIIGDGAVKLVDDIVRLFDTLKPLSRISTEVVYGRPFAEIVNYIPSMQMIIKGNHSEIDISDISMSSDNVSIANGSVGNKDIINTKGMSTTKEWLRRIDNNRSIVLDVMLLADNVGRLAALDYFTSFERREIQNMMNHRTGIHKKLAKFLGDTENNLYRVGMFNNATKTMWQNELENHTFIAPIQGIANKLVNLWARSKLSGLHQIFSQTLSNYAPFFVANINNPKKISSSFDAFTLMIRYNTGMTTERQNRLIEKITYEIKHRAQDTFLDKSANLNIKGTEIKDWFKTTGLYHFIKEADNTLEKVLFFPFKASDYIAGVPILLAEYLHNEIQRTGNTSMSFDDIVYNKESHHKAVDETERFIGIGNSSRRAEWLHNRDGLISFTRNLLTAFSSHRINNAMNFQSELRRITELDLSPEEKAKSAMYMAGIVAQTVVFGGVKFVAQAFIAKMIINAITGDNEDDIEELYMERDGMSQDEKKIINAEISFRRKIRSQVNQLKDRSENYEAFAVSLAKDGIINMFIIPSFGEMAVDMVFHLGYDQFQKESFAKWKEEELKRLKNLYKEEKGEGSETEASARIAEDISDLESQVYFPVTFETRSVAPLGGSFGGVMRGLEDAAETSINNFIRMKPVSTKDILNYLSVIGVAQPDLMKLAREADKVDKAKEEWSKKLEKIEEEDEETNVFSF